jgi:hypothetical protein
VLIYTRWEWAESIAFWAFLGWCLLGGPILIATISVWRIAHGRPLRSREPPLSGWKLVQADDFGALWDSHWPDHTRVVEVIDATPDRDGAKTTHRIRVPLTVRTAHEAVAWTFGFTRADEYCPDVET